MAKDKLTAVFGAGQVSIILAGAVVACGALAEIAAPGPVTFPASADFAVGACYAAIGAWLPRLARQPLASPDSGRLALAVSAAWFAGTAVSALPAYVIGVIVLSYRAVLAHLLIRSVARWRRPARRGTRLLAAPCYLAVLLPVPVDGFATAGLIAGLAVLAALTVQRVAADRRPVLIAATLAAVALAATWWLAASGVAGGDGLALANDAALMMAALAIVAGSAPLRWLPGAIHALVVDLGPSRYPELPVSGLLARVLADPELQVRYAVPGQGWVDEHGRPVEPPPAAGPAAGRVTRARAPGGGEVALIGGPTAEPGSALSRAAAAAAALAVENARISAEVREQAKAVKESRKRLLTVADEERQALAVRLRAGPGAQLQRVDKALAGLDGESARGIRDLLAGALADLEQLALGLFPATLEGRPLDALIGEIAAGMPARVRVDVLGPAEDLSPGLRALTYFFCSECLANMARHAGASTATVRVHVTAGFLSVSVADDGRGGASLAGSRGLRGLADRVEVAGGRLSVFSPPGGPTRISAEVPRSAA